MKRLKDFSRAQIKKIATEYAETDLQYTHSYFETEYEMSESTFFNMLDKAIIESIVDSEIAIKIGEKAAKNSEEKAGEYAAKRGRKHNSHLMMKREIFKFSKTEAKKIAVRYAKSPLSKKEFCKQNAIEVHLFDDALVRTISENRISDDIYQLIKEKALKNHNNSPKACELFQKLDTMRNNHKEKRD